MSQRSINRFLRGALVCGVLCVAALVTGGGVVSDYVFSPPRRPLQDYHTARLANPAVYGLTIRAFACCDGVVPSLLVEPDADAGLGERGTLLRRQLANEGVPLAPYGTVEGLVVLLHGRGGRKEDLLPVAERFVAAGFRCLLPDLPAHGASPLSGVAYGASEFERVLPRRLLNDARRRFNLPAEPAALWGLSMGGAFAVHAASESPLLWKALIVVSTFDALDEVVAAQSARYVGPLGAVVMRAVDHLGVPRGTPPFAAIRPSAWAGQVTVPTLVVHGDQDAVIPIARGRALFEKLATPEKRWVAVPGGRHHGILATPAPLYAEMSAWFLRWLRISKTSGGTHASGRGVAHATGIGYAA